MENYGHVVPTGGSITHHTISATTFVLCHNDNSNSRRSSSNNSDNLTSNPIPSEPTVALFIMGVFFFCVRFRPVRSLLHFQVKMASTPGKSSRYTAGIIFHGRTCRHLPFTPFTPPEWPVVAGWQMKREQINETI